MATSGQLIVVVFVVQRSMSSACRSNVVKGILTLGFGIEIAMKMSHKFRKMVRRQMFTT